VIVHLLGIAHTESSLSPLSIL